MNLESSKTIYNLLNSCQTQQELHDVLNLIVCTISESTANGKDFFTISISGHPKLQLIYSPEDNYFAIMEKSFGINYNTRQIDLPNGWINSYFPKTLNK